MSVVESAVQRIDYPGKRSGIAIPIDPALFRQYGIFGKKATDFAGQSFFGGEIGFSDQIQVVGFHGRAQITVLEGAEQSCRLLESFRNRPDSVRNLLPNPLLHRGGRRRSKEFANGTRPQNGQVLQVPVEHDGAAGALLPVEPEVNTATGLNT